MAIKKGFKKYEYENIRTEYKNLTYTDASDKVQEVAYDNTDKKPISAGTVIKITTSNTAVTVADAVSGDITNANMNSTVFLLAEDLKIGDYGFVYYIVEDVDNLEGR